MKGWHLILFASSLDILTGKVSYKKIKKMSQKGLHLAPTCYNKDRG